MSRRAVTAQVGLMPDPTLLGISLALILVGLVAISSASIEYAQINYGSTWFHTSRHLIYMLIAAVGAVAIYRVPLQFWEDTGWVWLFVALGSADSGADSGCGSRGQWQSALVADRALHAAAV